MNSTSNSPPNIPHQTQAFLIPNVNLSPNESPPTNGHSALPSPPESPSSSLLSLPTSLSLSNSNEEISGGASGFGTAWSSRAPSPGPAMIFPELRMRIPELTLNQVIPSSITSSEYNSPLTGAVQVASLGEGDNDTYDSMRIIVLGSGFPSLDEEILQGLKGEVWEWEEWEEKFNPVGDDPEEEQIVRVSFTTRRNKFTNRAATHGGDIWIGYIPLPSLSLGADYGKFFCDLKNYLVNPFRRLSPLLTMPPSAISSTSSSFSSIQMKDLRTLLSNPKFPYFNAIVMGLSSPPTQMQQNLLTTLSPLLPVLPLPPPPPHHRGRKQIKRRISAFRPRSVSQLRRGLFETDRAQVRGTLMEEVVEGFLRWWESDECTNSSPYPKRGGGRNEASSFMTTMQASEKRDCASMRADRVAADIHIALDPLDVRSWVYLLPLPSWDLHFPKEMGLAFGVSAGAFVVGLGIGLSIGLRNIKGRVEC